MSLLVQHGRKPLTASRRARRQAVRVFGSSDQLRFNVPAGKRVVILGGTGRVGSSTANTLLKNFPELDITVAGRSEESFNAALQRRPALSKAKFCRCDFNDKASLTALLAGADLVVHAAGPFQRAPGCAVLEAALEVGTPYLDVCDDTVYSERAKGYHAAAVAAGVPAITTGGIYPGTSNVMAAHMISLGRKEYDEAGRDYAAPQGDTLEPQRLLYTYYTAGSGGAGPTILETTFLLAGEEVVVYKDGQRYLLPPVSNARGVDFGPGVGLKSAYLYNLPEVESAHKYLRVPSVSARFSTDPFIWNWAMWLTARLMPRGLLNDRGFVKAFAKLSDPWVRMVDKVVGETVAMRVEVQFVNGKSTAGLFVHKLLSESMGYAVAGFALAVLEGQTQPGVWFPEEREAVRDRLKYLEFARTGTSAFALNRGVWALEDDPKQIGMGFYI